MTRTVKVRPFNRTVDGRREHVKGYTREGRGSAHSDNELPPEEPHEVEVSVHVSPHESTAATGKKEHVKGYSYKREEERFGGESKRLKRKIYEEYRRKGYSPAESERIAGDTVGDVYRRKLKEAGK